MDSVCPILDIFHAMFVVDIHSMSFCERPTQPVHAGLMQILKSRLHTYDVSRLRASICQPLRFQSFSSCQAELIVDEIGMSGQA